MIDVVLLYVIMSEKNMKKKKMSRIEKSGDMIVLDFVKIRVNVKIEFGNLEVE